MWQVVGKKEEMAGFTSPEDGSAQKEGLGLSALFFRFVQPGTPFVNLLTKLTNYV